MTKNRASDWLEPNPFGAQEAAFIRSPYHFYMPTYKERLGADTYTLIRDNLRVLTECFYGNPLTPGAVEVIHLHLDTLSRMLAFKMN